MRVISVSVGALVLPSTALRLHNLLKAKELVMSRDDAADHCRRLVSITPEGVSIMSRCLVAIAV